MLNVAERLCTGNAVRTVAIRHVALTAGQGDGAVVGP
jgi:hypothetical protein